MSTTLKIAYPDLCQLKKRHAKGQGWSWRVHGNWQQGYNTNMEHRLGGLVWWYLAFFCTVIINASGVNIILRHSLFRNHDNDLLPHQSWRGAFISWLPKMKITKFHIWKVACNVKLTNLIFMHEFLKASCHTQSLILQPGPAWGPCQWWNSHGRWSYGNCEFANLSGLIVHGVDICKGWFPNQP